MRIVRSALLLQITSFTLLIHQTCAGVRPEKINQRFDFQPTLIRFIVQSQASVGELSNKRIN